MCIPLYEGRHQILRVPSSEAVVLNSKSKVHVLLCVYCVLCVYCIQLLYTHSVHRIITCTVLYCIVYCTFFRAVHYRGHYIDAYKKHIPHVDSACANTVSMPSFLWATQNNMRCSRLLLWPHVRLPHLYSTYNGSIIPSILCVFAGTLPDTSGGGWVWEHLPVHAACQTAGRQRQKCRTVSTVTYKYITHSCLHFLKA